MAVQFVLGADPNVKRMQMIDHIYDQLVENPEDEIIYLVPDNVKYEAEMMVLEEFKKKKETKMAGMINLQIFSFSRLAWYYLQDQAIYQQSQLTESGLAMLLQKILKEEEEQLTIYRGASQEIGFIQRLIALFSEFRNGKIEANDLAEILAAEEQQNETADFTRKIQDLSYLYEKYNEAVQDSYLEREDLYQELITLISENQANFKNTIIYVDHYEHFSAQELELLLTLAKYSDKVLLNLTLTEEAIQKNKEEQNDLNNLFYRPLKTYHQLIEAFQLQGTEILDNYVIEENQNESSDLKTLQDYWIASNQSMTAPELAPFKADSYENIALWAAEDKDAEVLHIATTIKRMVATGNYRYKDFQIMTRDLAGYELSFEALFNRNELPFFIDQQETMAQHPLLEFIVSLFSLKKRYYRLDDIFRFLRTELFVPFDRDIDFRTANEEQLLESVSIYQTAVKKWREKIDTTENVALAFGYQGKDWTEDKDWVYSRQEIEEHFKQTEQEEEIEANANEVRALFRKEIVQFIESLDSIEKNRELATILYQFMEGIGVVETLEFWQNQLMLAGQLEEAKKHEQAWETFISLLDEFIEIIGDEDWDVDTFLSIIETGFEEATYSMVPPTIDQVLVTNYDLPKIQSKKIVFLIGLTDTELPQIQENQSLLTDEDREVVEDGLSSDKYLAVSELESVANEPFGFYLALLQASEKVYFTYPLSNEDNDESRMSPYLERIQQALDLDITLQYGNAISITPESADEYLAFIASEEEAFGQMIISLRHALDTYESPQPFWAELFNQLYDPTNIRQSAILQSLTHKNIPVPLTEDLAEKLYGEDLYLSVSQLESFYKDPYSHFLMYGLRLKERQLQELSPLESGNFYHDALDRIGMALITYEQDITKMTRNELAQITQQVFRDLVGEKKYRLAQSSHRMNFIFTQLAKTVENTVWAMIHQAKRSKFRPQKTELVFGQLGTTDNIQGLSFDLNGGRQLKLRGKIDRIDSFQSEDQLFAGVVDYKSSNTSFNYQHIYHGLMLQMITYLDTVLTYSKDIFGQEAAAIGAFYSTVQDQFVDLQKLGAKDLELQRLAEYQYDGLMIDQKELLDAADTLIEPKESSPIYRLYLKADGRFSYPQSQIITEKQLEHLIRFNQEKLIEAGNQIIAGKNTLQPFEKQQAKLHIPSVDGPYRAISQFDALLKENNYRKLQTMSKNQFFARLQEMYGNDEEGENE